MSDTTTGQPCPQAFFSPLWRANILRRRSSSNLPSRSAENLGTDLLARAAACCLVAASTGFGAVYAWSTGSGHGVVLGALSVLFAVSIEVCKPLAFRNALASFAQFNVIRGAALAILAGVAVVYSLTAEISLWSALRSDGMSQRQTAINSARRADTEAKRFDERYAIAKFEFDSIQPARSNSEVQAAITKLFADNPRAGDCSVLDGRVTRSICPQVELLKAEAQRGQRREVLKAEMAAASSAQVNVIAAPTTADPGATALATYLAAIGFGRLDVNLLTEWLSLIPVVALEVGSLFAGLLCPPASRAPSNDGGKRCSVTGSLESCGAPEPTGEQHVFTASSEAFTPATEKLSVPDCPSERLVHLLRSSGGTVFGGQRTFAKAVNISAAQVNSLLHELAAVGVVTLDVSKNGTRVKLVA